MNPLEAIRLSDSTPLARHYLAGSRRDLLKLARQTKRSPGRQRSGWWSAAENVTPHVNSGTPLARPCQLVPPYGKSNVCIPPLFIVTTDGLYAPRISTLALTGDKLACSSKGLSASAADHRRRPTAGCLPTLLCVSRPSTNESRFRVG